MDEYHLYYHSIWTGVSTWGEGGQGSINLQQLINNNSIRSQHMRDPRSHPSRGLAARWRAVMQEGTIHYCETGGQGLKEHCHEIFCFRFFFHESPSPKPLKIILGSFQIFCKNSRRYSQAKVHQQCQGHRCHWHRCHWHRWQIMGTISGCRHLKVNLKAKIYINVNSSSQCCPKKIMKIFLIGVFFHLPPVSTTPLVHFELRISPRIFKKNSKRPKGFSQGLGGNWFMKKNQKSKISCHCPFKGTVAWGVYWTF